MSNWSIRDLLDAGAGVLLMVVLFQVVGGVVSAAGVPTLSIGGGAVLSSPPVSFSDLNTDDRLQYATGWADTATAIIVILALIAVVLPRIVWENEATVAWGRRARLLLIAVAAVAVLTAVGAAVAIYNLIYQPGLPNFIGNNAEAASPVARSAATLVLALLAVAGSWVSWNHGGPGTEPGPTTDASS